MVKVISPRGAQACRVVLMIENILFIVVYFIGLMAILLPVGYLIDRMEKRHFAKYRAYLIEKYGEEPNGK